MINTPKTIKVLLADDHQSMIDGLRAVLQKEKDIEIVAEANNGIEVLTRLGKNEVDVVVLDIGMPEMDGHAALIEIQKTYPSIKVLILSLHKDEKNIGKVLKNNAAGYVIKDKGSEEIVKAIRVVASGKKYFDSEVTSMMPDIIKNDNRKSSTEIIKLSSQESAVVALLAEEMSSKEIASKLFIETSTVETHKKNAAVKLGLKISQLRGYAYKQKYQNNSNGDKI